MPCALSIRKAGGTSPSAARSLHAAELAIELLRVRLQPREIRLGVGGVVDPMFAIQEARDIQIGADVLDHDVRCIAPAADRHVAVRKREPLECNRIGASTTSRLVRVACESPRVSNALTRARSARICFASRCCPR